MKNISTFRASASSRQKLLGWILNAWDYLSEDTIKSGFGKTLLVESSVILTPKIAEEHDIPDSLLNELENINIINDIEF